MRQHMHFSQGMKFRDYDVDQMIASLFQDKREKLKDTRLFYLNMKRNTTMMDYLESPVYLISERMKGILELLEDDLEFQSVTLYDDGQKKHYDYHQMFFPRLDAISDNIEYHRSAEEKQLTLDASKIGHHHIFLLENSLSIHPVVSLEVVECLLRRKAVGIIFEEMEVE